MTESKERVRTIYDPGAEITGRKVRAPQDVAGYPSYDTDEYWDQSKHGTGNYVKPIRPGD